MTDEEILGTFKERLILHRKLRGRSETMQQIAKIKAQPGKPVEIHWTEAEDEAEYHLRCAQSPRPELYDAMKAFRGFVTGLLELPKDYADALRRILPRQMDRLARNVVIDMVGRSARGTILEDDKWKQ